MNISIENHPLHGGVATILDDDPKLVINDVSQTEGNSGSKDFTFTVGLTDGNGNPIQAADDVLVDFATSAGSNVSNPQPGQIYETTPASTFTVPEQLDPRSFVLSEDPDFNDAQGVDTSTSIRHLSILGRGNEAFDYYAFNGTQGQHVILDVDGATFDSQIVVYDSSGNVVFSNDDGFVHGGLNGDALDPGSTSTEDSFLDFVLQASDRYTIAVGRSTSTPTATGLTGTPLTEGDQYTLNVSIQNYYAPPGTVFEADPVTGQEKTPNNTLATAQSLEGEYFNKTFNANINSQTGVNVSATLPYVIIQGTGDGTADYYSFQATAGQTGIFDVDGASFDSKLSLFGPSGALAVPPNDNSNVVDAGSSSLQDAFLQTVFNQTGTYTIQISDANQPTGVIAAGATYRLNVVVGGHSTGTPPVFSGPTPTDGTATPNSDFDPINVTTSSGTTGFLKINQGDTTGTITVSVFGDLLNEPPSEDFFVRLLDASYANIAGHPTIQDGVGEGIILNDDAPVLQINDPAPVKETGALGTPNIVQFVVSLHNPDGSLRLADVDTTVKYSTADGTANAGQDYVGQSGTLTIPKGSSSGTINIQLIKDGILNEGNETFFVNLSNPGGATLDDTQGVGTIIDNTGLVENVLTVTAPDAGGPGIVKVFDASGALRFQFEPYPGFLGGVRVATGDVNNDGTPDIITGPGPGGGPNVMVFSGVDGSVLANFMAFNPGFTGGIYVAAGDFAEGVLTQGDSFDDIVVGADAGGGPNVKIFSSATGQPNNRVFTPFGIENRVLFNDFAFDPGFTGGVRVAAGDVTGDGTDDLVVAAGPGGGPNVKVYSGRNLKPTAFTNFAVRSFFAYSPQFTGGIYIAVADVDINSPVTGRAAEIITGAGFGGGPDVRVFNVASNVVTLADFFAYTAAFTGGVRVSAGDVNGDTIADIITAPGQGGGPNVRAFDGRTVAGASNQNPPTLLNNFNAYKSPFTDGVFVAGVLNVDVGQQQLAAKSQVAALGTANLTQAEVDAVLPAALDRLRAAGVSEAEIEALSHVHISVADLSGNLLGLSAPGNIVLDVNAAGNGWFIDPTPGLDEEFANLDGSRNLTAVSGLAIGHTDLLTVLLHELGHRLGLEDISSQLHPDALMGDTLPVGTRRLPSSEDLDDAFADDSLFDSLLLN